MNPKSRTLCKYMLSIVTVQASLPVLCLNVSEANDLYNSLLANYNRKLLPLVNQSETAHVGVFVYLLSINTFDELSGELALTLIFNISWKEERMSWCPKDYDGKTSLLISPEDIWRPKTFVRESFDTLQEVGNGSEMLRISFDGVVVWTLGSVLKVTCPVDVTFFPFDKQKCTITLTSLSVKSEDVSMYTLKSSTDTRYWANNSQWIYQNSSVYSYALPDGPTGIIIDITLKRRSEFYIIYIIVPLVFLGGMNNLVFYMPASFGERTSVAITAFLSFAVYMQIVNNNVPQSSSPIAYIYYYLMFLLLYSSYITFACIVSMRIYDRKGKVPCYTKYLVISLRCMCCRRRNKNKKRKVIAQETMTSQTINADCGNARTEYCELQNHVNGEPQESSKKQQKDESEEDEVTWTLVGKTFDTYCSGFNFLVYWSFTGVTFLCLYINAEILKSF